MQHTLTDDSSIAGQQILSIPKTRGGAAPLSLLALLAGPRGAPPLPPGHLAPFPGLGPSLPRLAVRPVWRQTVIPRRQMETCHNINPVLD